mmetsp:Transcript_16981/g.23765  ORF Transcript_16981/g.23765 Transcript_16981/m.23765 type:complete len:269 (-) Transcript_16981:778-1584(-)
MSVVAQPKRMSTRIANGNSKYSGIDRIRRDIRIDSSKSYENYKLEYESPKNAKLLRNKMNPTTLGRNIRHSMLPQIDEELELQKKRPEETDDYDDDLDNTDTEDSDSLADVPEANPMDMISAAATTVELCTQSQNIAILEHQCMIVQQDFDMMQAEKEEEIAKQKKFRMQAEKRAREAEERCKELYEQLMDVKCKLFEKTGEIKAAAVARIDQCSSTPKEEPVPFTETSTPGKQQRKRNRRIQPSLVPSNGTKKACKKLRLITRQKSF